MTRNDLRRSLFDGIVEYYRKQGIEPTEELEFSFLALAEFLAEILAN